MTKRIVTQEGFDNQFKLIIDSARSMLDTEGEISMRKLAKSLHMGNSSAASLYRYVNNKRELWFAIVSKDLEKFQEGIINASEQKHLSAVDRVRLAEDHYMNFAAEDSTRFRRIFYRNPPRAEKNIGPFELRCNNEQGIDLFQNMVKQALKERNMKDDALKFALMLNSIVLGGSISIIQLVNSGDPNQIAYAKDFQVYLLDQTITLFK